MRNFKKQFQRSANKANKQIKKITNQVIAGIQAPIIGNGKMHPNDNKPLPEVSSSKPTEFK